MHASSPHYRIGLDEAGRGAWAGPVVAGAVYLPRPLAGLADSKVLSPAKREYLFSCIAQQALYGIGVVSALEIDAIGIKAATNKAMCLALEEVQQQLLTDIPVIALVDGSDRFTFPVPHRSFIRGDSLFASISAASIVAKVHRDRLMIASEESHPGYGFGQHKGYGTELHTQCMARLGVCGIHRKTYAPVARVFCDRRETS